MSHRAMHLLDLNVAKWLAQVILILEPFFHISVFAQVLMGDNLTTVDMESQKWVLNKWRR